jgi:hypothetical protein
LPYVGAVDVPVPPLVIPRTPVISFTREIVEVAITPAVALRNPESEPRVRLFDMTRLLLLAVPVTAKLVDVALVVVAFVAVKFVNVAAVAIRVSITLFVKFATLAKKFVLVAAVATSVSEEKVVEVECVVDELVTLNCEVLVLNVNEEAPSNDPSLLN